jgi:hypothetical protein
MSGDFRLSVRQATLIFLQGWAVLADLIPADSMYPATVAAGRTFPFLRFGSMIPTPFRASGLNASSIRMNLQAFTKPVYDADTDAMLVTAEDRAIEIGSALKDALDGRTLAIDPVGKVRFTWIASSPQRDGAEADAWMTTVTFQAEVEAN